MRVKTIGAEQVWQSSDGQRTIWEVRLRRHLITGAGWLRRGSGVM